MSQETTIEQINIEITASSSSAEKGLASLEATLGRVRNVAKGGIGLTTVTNQLAKLNAIVQASPPYTALNKLADGLKALNALEAPKLNIRTVANQLERLREVMPGINAMDMTSVETKLGELATGLNKLKDIEKSNLGSVVTQLSKIPSITEQLDDETLKNFAKACQETAIAVKPLATEMEKVSNGFNALPTKIKRVISQLDSMSSSTAKAWKEQSILDKVLSDVRVKFAAYAAVFKRIWGALSDFADESNKYVEDMNLFNVAMGDGAKAAREYAYEVQNALSIDAAAFMRNQGVFQQIVSAFGIASSQATVMSQNLTQLGYDISSFFNISVEEAMTKLQSGIAGELEPLRRLGYALDTATLQQVAYRNGIEKNISSMTQAEKSQLRYLAIMEQSKNAMGDMARTINSPANAMRVLNQQVTMLKRSLGNILIPILLEILPYVIAFTKVLTQAAQALAKLVGYEFPTFDYSSVTNVGIEAGVAADKIGDIGSAATKAGKQIRKDLLLTFDELNVLSDKESGGSGGGASVGGLSGVGSLLDELPSYDFLGGLDGVNEKVNEITESIKKCKPMIVALATVLGVSLATKGALKATKALEGLRESFSGLQGVAGGFATLGLLTFISDLEEFLEYFEDFSENGATFQNVTGMISEFAGMVGDSLTLLGSYKYGGALKVVQGIGEICVAIKDIADNGVDWENATTAIRGLTNVAIGIGAFTKKLKVAGWAMAIQGLTSIIDEIAENWDAIKQGDWSGVDKVALITGALEVLGGLALALDAFGKLKSMLNIGQAAKTGETLATATQSLDTTVSSTLSPRLSSLAKNLGMGLVIIGEVAAAALLIGGAIILLGMELEQVGIAWEPVIQNGENIAIAIGLGTAALVAVGVVTAVLGSAGTPLMVNIALGTAVLAELGVATGLFLGEIWVVGKLLDEIGKAWQPVLDNGNTITMGIAIGTGILIAIGVVTAALGAATVATAGLLPLAIGLGTALLVELSAAFILFTESLVAVANELSINLAPSLEGLNNELPTLSDNMSKFVDFMKLFAGHIVAYSESTTIAGLAATIDTIIGWFTRDPFEKLANDVGKVGEQTITLNEKLNAAVPELEKAASLFADYDKFLTEIEKYTESSYSFSENVGVNMKEVGKKIITGLTEGIKSKASDYNNVAKEFVNGFQKALDNKIKSSTFNKYGKDMMNGVKQGVLNSKSEYIDSITKLMNDGKEIVANNKQKYETAMKDVVQKLAHTVTSDRTVESSIRTMLTKTSNVIRNDSSIKDAFKAMFGGSTSSFDNMFKELTNKVRSDNSLVSAFEKVFNKVLSKTDSWAGKMRTAVNDMLSNWSKSMNSVSFNSQGKMSFTPMGKISIPRFEQGGYPSTGQLFIAREAGAEMVGSIGNKTAVANNDQIVEAVALGVYQAIKSAQEGESKEINANITVTLDGETVYRNQQQIAAQKGYDFGMKGFANV